MGLNKRQLQQDKKHLTKAKAPSKPNDVLYTKNGQYDFPGEITKVPTTNGRITMAGVSTPLYGVDNTGYTQMMYPEKEYQFPGDVVTEYPIKQFGGDFDDSIILDLTEEQIKEYAEGGFIIEDISIPSLNQFSDGGEKNYYTVKGSNAVYRKVNGKWEIDTNKSGNFQPLSKGDVKKRTEQLNKNAEQYFDTNYDDLIRSKKAEYKEAPKNESKPKSSSNSSGAQKIFKEDFKVTKKSNLEKANDEIEKGVDDFVKFHNENSNQPLSQEDIENARQNISQNIWASEGVYNPAAGENINNVSTISNEDDKHIIKTEFPENASASDYAQRGWEYLTNPGTALEYALGNRQGSMPFNINELKSKGVNVDSDRNLVGQALNMINPLDDAQSVLQGVNDITKGDNSGYVNAGFGLLGFLPGGDYLKGLKKSGKVAENLSDAVKTGQKIVSKEPEITDEMLEAYNLAVDLKNRGKISNVPESPQAFDKWLQSQYNTQPLYRVVDVNPQVMSDPIIKSNMIKQGLDPTNEYHVAEYMGTSVAPSEVINRGRRSGGHDELLKGSNKDILYFAEDPSWIGSRYGGNNPYYVKTYADEIPKGLKNQVLGLRGESRIRKNYSRNYPGFDINNVPSGALFEDKYLSVGPNSITPIIGDKGSKVRNAVHIVKGSDFERLPNKRFKQGGLNKNDFIYVDLNNDEIKKYVEDGYIVESTSMPSLNQYDNGGIFNRRKKKQEEQLEYRPPVEVNDEMYESVTPFPEAPEDFKQGVGNIKEVDVKAQAPDWLKFSNEYEKKNSRQAFIDEKKREYLKGTNQGLIKQAGYNMENFPPDVERRFEEAYDYKKNSFIVKKLGKKEKFSPNRRGEWVDELSKKEKEIVANSKYESKLQPSLWDRTLAGLVTLTTPFDARANDAMNRGELPGLTKKEQREIKDSKILGIPTGGLEAFSGLDVPGVAIANVLEQSGNSGYGAGYREAPGMLSGQPMANVKPEQVMALNPLNYTLPYDIVAGGASMIKGAKELIEKSPGEINKLLINNKGKFSKPTYGELEVNLDPSQISRLNQIDEARGITAYQNPNKSTQITKFIQNTKLSDDDIIKIFGKTKEELLNIEEAKKTKGATDNQLPPPPETIIIDPVNVDLSIRPEEGSPEYLEQYLNDLEDIEDNPGRALAFNPDRAIELYNNPSTRDRVLSHIPNIRDLITLRNESRISENQNLLDHLEDVEDDMYQYLISNRDITDMLLNDHTTQPRVRDILLAGPQNQEPISSASTQSARVSQNDYSIPAYLRRNPGLAEQLRRSNTTVDARYNLGDITLPANSQSNMAGNTKSFSEELAAIPKNFKNLFNIPEQEVDNLVVPSLYAAGYKNKRQMLETLNKKISEGFDLALPDEVITGSTNTSYNSYLPQMEYIFKNAGKEGLSEPVFLGYKPMNSSGFLSEHGETLEDILEYVNHNLNKIQKRSGKNLNLGMYKPYINETGNWIYLPQYGLRKTGHNVAKIVKEKGGEIIVDNLTNDQLKEYLDGGYIIEKIN